MVTSKGSANSNALTEQFLGQVSDSIQLVFDLTSRIDERVKMLTEMQKELDDQIEKLLELQQTELNRLLVLESKDIGTVKMDLQLLNEKISVLSKDDPHPKINEFHQKHRELEIKVEGIILRMGTHDNRWAKAFDAFWKILLMVIAGYILYKLGLQAPPT